MRLMLALESSHIALRNFQIKDALSETSWIRLNVAASLGYAHYPIRQRREDALIVVRMIYPGIFRSVFSGLGFRFSIRGCCSLIRIIRQRGSRVFTRRAAR